ncbi:MAG: hypothetical protein CMF52_05900 [Legionellales bacterium]|nr:hypothetical protein [Legionellales bacterium]
MARVNRSIQIVVPSMSKHETKRTSKGPQVSLLDLFPVQHSEFGPPAFQFLRVAPPSCLPGDEELRFIHANETVSCTQSGRSGLLRCAPRLPATPCRFCQYTSRDFLALGTGVQSRCAYWFIRRPLDVVDANVHLVMSNAKFHAQWSPVPLHKIIVPLRSLFRRFDIKCLEVNVVGTNHTIGKLLSALKMGLPDDVLIQRRMRPPGTASNAAEMHVAADSRLFISEIGTLWSDDILTRRCCLKGAFPAMILEHKNTSNSNSTVKIHINAHCTGSRFFRGNEISVCHTALHNM